MADETRGANGRRVLYAVVLLVLILGTPWTVEAAQIFARGALASVFVMWLAHPPARRARPPDPSPTQDTEGER